MAENNQSAKELAPTQPPAGTKGRDLVPCDGDNLDLLLDIPLEITIELGRTKMLINDLLKLGQGSVIELAKEAGDTLEILANNRLIAKGDVVVVNKKYGIRLTEVISPMERVEKLG
jgi:flagellar motor switch protein FliN/FliY